MEPPLLRVQVSMVGDVAVARLSGELDLTGSAPLLEGLRPAVDLAARALVVDLRALRFVDCAGLTALVAARSEVSRRGIELVLAAPSPPVARLLSLTGSGRRIPVFRTVRQAVNRYRLAAPTVPRTVPRARQSAAGLRRPGPVVPLPGAPDRPR